MTEIQWHRAEVKRGRKIAIESRASAIRAALAAWKLTPKSQRISLRALARSIGTSHQLVGHYLASWETWQAREYRRQAREIRTRAETEMKPWVVNEMLGEAKRLETAALQSVLTSLLNDNLERIERKARFDPLSRHEVKILKLFAARGYRKAKEILEKRAGSNSKSNLPPTSVHSVKSFELGEPIGGNSSKTREPVSDENAAISAKPNAFGGK